MRKVTSRAPINIALIKYWGKKDSQKVLPYNSSLSMTLDNLYTITSIEESDSFEFILNNEIQSETEANKIKIFLLNFATLDQIDKVKIFSENHVPTAAGLASSASAYAALSLAVNRYFNTNYNMDTLINVSKKGSGSSCRSFYGGFVAWENDGSVYEVNSRYKDFVMISVIISKFKKNIPSRKAMEITMDTSPLYPYWVNEANQDFSIMKKALEEGDIQLIGELSEKSAKLMHATILASSPPISYFKEETFLVWDLVLKLRNQGVYAYATMDAGPNVKILTNIYDYQLIINELELKNFNDYYISNIGKGASIVNESI